MAMADVDELLSANDAFYASVSQLDLALMEELWLHDDWVRCIHPGWDVLVGWRKIRDSFSRIFRDTGWIRVIPTAVSARTIGDIGIVTCAENITSEDEGHVGVGMAQATNVFQRRPEGWKLIVHHSSPAPVTVTSAFSGTVQ
jgi:ketosteroid isomerase-like protein